MSASATRVLLLEDTDVDAELVQTSLAHSSTTKYEFVRARRLSDAVAKIRDDQFDVVLSDLGLPDSVGLGTVEAITACNPALPVVVLTGMDDAELGRNAIIHGAEDYLVKGDADGKVIVRTLRYAIERKRLETRLREANETLERRVGERTAELEAANRRLRASETRFRGLTELASDWYWEQDENFRFSWFSRDLPGVTSTGGTGHIGKQRWELGIEGVTQAQWDDHRRTLEAHLPFRDFEFMLPGSGGEAHYVSVSGQPIFDEDGRFRGYRGVGRDITERTRVSEALQASEERLRTIFEGALDGILVADARTGRFLAANPAICHMLGYRIDEIANIGIEDIHRPQDLPQAIEPFEKMRRGEIQMATDIPVMRKDGSVLYTDIRGAPVRLGDRDCMLGILRDTTERRLAAQQLSDAEAQFRGLVEQSIAGIFIVRDGKFAYVNPRFAEILGYDRAEDLIGGDGIEIVAEKDRPTVLENRRRLLEGEARSANYIFAGLRKDGTVAEVGVHSTRATHRGRPAIIGLMQDISEKRRAEEQIGHYINQLEKTLMGTVSVATTLSELRDPYTAGHERRVAEIAVAVGTELGLDKRRLEGLRVAGYLHDIGKITIPAEILAKPGRLSAIEFELIRGHPAASYGVLKQVEFPWPVAEIVLRHHERMDGSGYPDGFKGEAIILEARILAVADTVEAMSSHRPYRPGLGIDVALAEIEARRGTSYDPEVVDACLRLFREKGFVIPDPVQS